MTDPDVTAPDVTAPDLATRVAALRSEPGYETLLGQLRERIEAYGEPARVTLRDLDAPARQALADLLGRRDRPGATVTVTIEQLDRSLRGSRVGAGLIEVLEAAGGPLRDRRREAREQRGAWDDVHDELAERVAGHADLEGWLAGLRGDGLLVRLGADPGTARELGSQALDVLERLPAPAVPLSVLAAEVTGDPHALDAGAPLATVVLRGAAHLVGDPGLPSGARERRRLWSEVGVVCDPLSSSVLVLGLRPGGADIMAQMLDDHGVYGEPVRLTLRQLQTAEDIAFPVATVSICENPSVMVAAADAYDWGCEPLICTEGVPDAAADQLLRDLRAAGCELRFHADFDGGGLRIGNLLNERYGATPWRMMRTDYEHALEGAAVTTALPSLGVEARWDGDLAPTMRRHGRVVSEEQVLADLLADLRTTD